MLGTGVGTTAASPPAQPSTDAVPGELLVGFRSNVSATEQQKILKRAGALEKRKFKGIHGALAQLRPSSEQSAIDQLSSDPRVRYAERNLILSTDATPNDPFFTRLWGLNNTGQLVGWFPGTPDADIDAPEAWSVTTGSSSVTVAVIDTGMDYTHPDLAPQLWINPGENCAGCRNDGIDNDGNGYVDDWRGWDFANHDNAPLDDNGHGTHVAGTIGAVGNNGIGVSGINWHVRLMPLKFLNAAGSGTTADAVSAVLYASAQGADVINASWGGDGYSQALSDAIATADARGSLFVAAAGNSGTDNDTSPSYPASYDLPNVISVAATDNSDNLAWFSNVGRQSVDLAAPGVNIYSTYPGNSYQYSSGTSMAAPHVSGAAALVEAAFPTATAIGIKNLLLASVDPIGALATRTATGGRLNLATAVTCNGSPKIWVDAPAAGFAADVGRPIAVTAFATQCATAAGVQLSAAANGIPLALTSRGDGLYSASYTPTAAGQVTITLTATAASGSTATRTISGIASQVVTITPGGPPLTVTTTVADQNVRLRFDGQAGQRISLKLSAVTIPTSYVSIFNPDGTPLVSNAYVSALGSFVDTRTLPVAGAYTILVDPQGPATGAMTLTLYDVPPDTGGTLVSGVDLPVTTTTPGQNARLSFDGRSGGRISIKLSAGPTSYLSVLKPDGTQLGGTTYVGAFGGFVDTISLPSTGTYTIFADPQDAATGSFVVTLYDVPPDVTGTSVAGGAAQSVNLAAPGQNARLSLDGHAGQRISVKLSNSSISSAYVSLLKPDGTSLGGNSYVGTGGGFLDTRALPVDGTYTIVIDPQGAATGSMTLAVCDVPPDLAATIAPGGVATLAIPVPGQNARLTFTGRAAQRVSLRIGAVTIANSYVSILKPDGTSLGGNAFVGTSGGFLDTRTLPADGTYTIVLDPVDAAIGSATVNLYDVPADATATLVAGGPAQTVTVSTPGQNAQAGFAGTAGQAVTLSLSPLTLSVSYVSILRPDGTALISPTLVTSPRTMTATLPATGNYTVFVDPLSDLVGAMTLTLN